MTCARFRLFPVRSPLLRESRSLSFPGATEMCHFTPLTNPALCIQAGPTPIARRRVVPSEISGSNACLRLTGAYRSLPRPLSSPRAKASTEHPFLLDRTHPTAEPSPAPNGARRAAMLTFACDPPAGRNRSAGPRCRWIRYAVVKEPDRIQRSKVKPQSQSTLKFHR